MVEHFLACATSSSIPNTWVYGEVIIARWGGFVIQATEEAEAGGSLEPRNLRPACAISQDPIIYIHTCKGENSDTNGHQEKAGGQDWSYAAPGHSSPRVTSCTPEARNGQGISIVRETLSPHTCEPINACCCKPPLEDFHCHTFGVQSGRHQVTHGPRFSDACLLSPSSVTGSPVPLGGRQGQKAKPQRTHSTNRQHTRTQQMQHHNTK